MDPQLRTKREPLGVVLADYPGLSHKELAYVVALRDRLAFIEGKLSRWNPQRAEEDEHSQRVRDIIKSEQAALRWVLKILTGLHRSTINQPGEE